MLAVCVAGLFACQSDPIKNTKRMDPGITEWMGTEFVVKVPASFTFKELVDYLVSLPPYNVGYEIESGSFTIPEGRKLELPPGRYLRSDIIAKASSAFDIDILVDDDQKLRFKSWKQRDAK